MQEEERQRHGRSQGGKTNKKTGGKRVKFCWTGLDREKPSYINQKEKYRE